MAAVTVRTWPKLILICAALFYAPTATGRSVKLQGYATDASPMTVLLMPPDVDVGTVTAGGMIEPNKDWTDQARTHLVAAIMRRQSQSGGRLLMLDQDDLPVEDRHVVDDVIFLHNAVTRAILAHELFGYAGRLPTKKKNFDWSLGKTVQALWRHSGADHALFLLAYDSFSSGTRVASNLLNMAFGIIPQGGHQDALASLVNLETGQVVWMAYEGSMGGDIREPAGAQVLIDKLLAEMPGAPPQPTNKKR